MEYKGLVKKEKVWLKLFLDDEKVKEFQNELDRDQVRFFTFVWKSSK